MMQLHQCEALGCGDKRYARGMCNKHYQRLRRNGHLGLSYHKHVKVATKCPTAEDLYWIAGFLEGEGCFRRSGPKKETETVQCNNTDMEPLTRLQEIFGGSLIDQPKKHYNPRAKDQFSWYACGARARGIMQTLYPLVGERRQQQIRKARKLAERTEEGELI